MAKDIAIILAAGLVLAALLNGGIYQFANGGGNNYRLNRFTGQIVRIQPDRMVKVSPPSRWVDYFRMEEPTPPPPPPTVPR